jgi:hypothetical protein
MSKLYQFSFCGNNSRAHDAYIFVVEESLDSAISRTNIFLMDSGYEYRVSRNDLVSSDLQVHDLEPLRIYEVIYPD